MKNVEDVKQLQVLPNRPEPHDLLSTMETWKEDRPHKHTSRKGQAHKGRQSVSHSNHQSSLTEQFKMGVDV